MFGMTPFGWRFMGNLFGIFMIFAIYLLARRITKKPWFAFIAAFLLTFDFMHFTQTRIATIDSYPVVFILLSYYFMYCFYAGNYQKTGLRQPLLALLGSGIFFGLACASKWTGIYSGFGLAAIFFVHMAGRLREYLQAKKQGGAAEKAVAAYGRQTAVILLCCVGFFIVIPSAIYFASYIRSALLKGILIPSANCWITKKICFLTIINCSSRTPMHPCGILGQSCINPCGITIRI